MARGKNKDASDEGMTSFVPPTPSHLPDTYDSMNQDIRHQEALAFARGAVTTLELATEGKVPKRFARKHAKKMLKKALEFLEAA